MTNELVPGLNHIDIHEARLTGPFDLLRADLATIRVGARVMVCVVADVVLPMTFAETKDGDVKAKWTLKPIDVALVREEGMQQHLSNALNMIGVDGDDTWIDDEEETLSTTLIGQYDDEGAFVGMATEVDLETEPVLGDDEDEIVIDHGDHPDRDEYVPTTRPAASPGRGTGEVETFGKPVRHKDKHLASFLDERVPA